MPVIHKSPNKVYIEKFPLSLLKLLSNAREPHPRDQEVLINPNNQTHHQAPPAPAFYFRLLPFPQEPKALLGEFSHPCAFKNPKDVLSERQLRVIGFHSSTLILGAVEATGILESSSSYHLPRCSCQTGSEALKGLQWTGMTESPTTGLSTNY